MNGTYTEAERAHVRRVKELPSERDDRPPAGPRMNLDVIAHSPQAAHDAITEAWRIAKPLTIAGRAVHIVAKEAEDDRTLQQLRFYWGVVLKEMSEQASIDGVKYTPEMWHGLAKRLHLGYEIVREKVAGRKKPTVYRRLKSVGKLGSRAMSVYLEKVLAWAVTDFGVVFSEQMP